MDDQLAARLREDLIATLYAEGVLRSPRWVQAFRAVPREEFLTRFFVSTEDGGYAAVGPGSDRERWLRLVYTDEAWITQVDANPDAWSTASDRGRVEGAPTSSSSAPQLMANMLEALDVRPDSRVLELGTGTGYNAALLCEGLSDEQVASVDIDHGLVEAARLALSWLGYRPLLQASDGDAGHVPGIPYDRMVVTYGVPRIPHHWLAYMRPGGAIVAALRNDLPSGAMIRLTVLDDETAQGRFLPFYGAFMPTRRRAAADVGAGLAAARRQAGSTRETRLDELTLGAFEPWMFYASLALGEITVLDVLPDEENPERVQHWMLAPDGSWAYQTVTPQGLVTQGGPRLLWTELEAALDDWERLGRPGRTRLGLTVTPRRQLLWLDDPTNIIA